MIVQCSIIVSLLIAAGASYFWLDPKVANTKRSDFMNALKKQLTSE
jgi:hypothetical protein